MLQGKLDIQISDRSGRNLQGLGWETYTGHLYAGGEVRGAVDLRPMQAGQNLAKVCGERRKNLGAITTHAHEADGRLRMCAHLGRMDDADSVCLCLPSCRAGRCQKSSARNETESTDV